MQHARADSARRALPQGELQASVYGDSAAGYVSAVQVVAGQTAMATRINSGAKFGPLKDGKENALLLVPRKSGDVLAVSSPALAGHLTYPSLLPPTTSRPVFLPRCCCASAVRSLPFLCFRRPRLLRESLFRRCVRSFRHENGELRATQCRDGDHPVCHTGNKISRPELRQAARDGKGNAAATMAAVTGASSKRGWPYWLMNMFPILAENAPVVSAAFQKVLLDFVAQWRVGNPPPVQVRLAAGVRCAALRPCEAKRQVRRPICTKEQLLQGLEDEEFSDGSTLNTFSPAEARTLFDAALQNPATARQVHLRTPLPASLSDGPTGARACCGRRDTSWRFAARRMS